MSKRFLVAGIGNIFLGDDAFGVEVVRALFNRAPIDDTQVVDYGIRSFDLAYALLEPWEAVILVDAVTRGETAGTLYTIAPDVDGIIAAGRREAAVDAHSMDPVRVLEMAAALGEIPKQVFVVGCEPGDCGGDEGRMGLTPEVEAAIPEAVLMVEELIQDLLGNKNAVSMQRLNQEARGS